MPTTSVPKKEFRTDIQVLRGYAVLIVVLYHAKFDFFAAGYLGVDVFFVISGFLITGLVRNAIERGSFSFSEFYFRRAKRLLPAAYVTFLATALLAPIFLTGTELSDFRQQLIGAVTFTANFVLWQQSGYFQGAADLKPLLHVWSLAIEEQYYFLLPALMFFMPRRFWLSSALLAVVVSFALCIVFSERVAAIFYLLPFRAWELAIGSIGALIVLSPRSQRILSLAFWPALVGLLVLPTFSFGQPHPGIQALLICCATLIVILRRHPVLFRGAAIKIMERFGDASYSIYLVHWPLFAFFNNVWVGPPEEQPRLILLGLVVVSLALAFLLNRYVEEPLRHARFLRPGRAVAGTVVASIALVLTTSGMMAYRPAEGDYEHRRRVNTGFDQACSPATGFAPLPECRNSEQPELLVWGDSFAMHLVPGLAEGIGIAQATKSVCGPLIGVAAVIEERGYDRGWATECIEFNDAVIDYLRETPSISAVVLSSPFTQYVYPDGQLLIRSEDAGDYELLEARADIAVVGLQRTISTVRDLGRRVVVIAPPPENGADMSRCVERSELALPILGASPGCAIPFDAYREYRHPELELLSELKRRSEVNIISFDPHLCDETQCDTHRDGIMIFRDEGHLSYEGSRYLARSMDLVRRIEELAK